MRGYTGKNKDGSDKYMQIMLTFNPVSVLSWLKERFWDQAENSHIIYGENQAQALSEDINTYDTLIIHSTAYDNHFIDDGYIKELEELKKYDKDEYNVYCKGLWGVPGGIFFDKHKVNERIQANPQPIKTGYFEYQWNDPVSFDKIVGEFKYDPDTDECYSTEIKWVDDPDGPVKLYELPRWGHPYVAGGDTAGDGSDFNTAAFTDNSTGADVATVRTLLDEDEYARQMYCVGRYYNNALLGIETNFSTHPVKELLRLGYTNQYVREETPDKFTGKLTPRFGFRTDKLTRPLALGMLRAVVREHPEHIKDLGTLHEMTTFAKNEKGKPEAMQGSHDDMILARAINCYVAPQQTTKVKDKPVEKPKIRAHKEKLAKRNTAHIRRARLV